SFEPDALYPSISRQRPRGATTGGPGRPRGRWRGRKWEWEWEWQWEWEWEGQWGGEGEGEGEGRTAGRKQSVCRCRWVGGAPAQAPAQAHHPPIGILTTASEGLVHLGSTHGSQRTPICFGYVDRQASAATAPRSGAWGLRAV